MASRAVWRAVGSPGSWQEPSTIEVLRLCPRWFSPKPVFEKSRRRENPISGPPGVHLYPVFGDEVSFSCFEVQGLQGFAHFTLPPADAVKALGGVGRGIGQRSLAASASDQRQWYPGGVR